MIDIEIEETGERLIMLPKNRLRVTFQSADIRTAGTASSSFSTTAKIPATNENVSKLGFKTVVSIHQYGTVEIIKARLLAGDNELDKGFIRINEIDLNDREISLTFFGRNVDWFTKLKGLELRDIDLSIYDHENSEANINSDRTEGYIYLPVNYGGVSDRATATIYSNEIYPAMFVRDLIKHIFKDIGYKVKGSLFSRPELSRMLIPYSGLEPLHSNEWIDSHSFKATGNGVLLYSSLASVTYGQKVHFALTKVELNNTSFINTKKSIAGDFNESSSSYVATEPMLVDLNIKLLVQTVGIGINKMIFYIYINGSMYYTSPHVYSEFEFNLSDITLNAGDYVEIYAMPVASFPLMRIVMREEATALTDDIYTGDVHSWWAITPKKTIVINSKYQMSWFLPKLKQSDFIEWVLFHFNCIVSFDSKTNSVVINTMNDLSVSNSEDWSDKIDLAQPISKDLVDFVSDYSKKNICKYEHEKEDIVTEAYLTDNGVEYGQGSIDISNDYLDTENEYYTAPFLPSKSIQCFTGVAGLQFWLPSLFRKDNGDAYILYYCPNVSVSDLSNGVISSVTIASVAQTHIPYSYFVSPISSVDDPIINTQLAFDIPENSAVGGVGVLDQNYGKIKKVLNRPETISASLFLSALEIAFMDFTKLKYIEALGGYFYLNKIGQYDASGESVECELIKWA